MTREHAVPAAPRSLVAPLLFSVALVAPFLALEWVNLRPSVERFPFLLFTFMSLHALCIAALVTPALRCLGAERHLGALTRAQWAGLLMGVVLSYLYGAVVSDQLPCFLGVPNCD